MTLYGIIFYLLAATILVSTGLAITRRNLVHTVAYLVLSFFGSAMLFYLLGAPLLAALEVIIYAGAIMILFLFIVMMLRVETLEKYAHPFRRQFPAGVIGLVFFFVAVLLVTTDPETKVPLEPAVASPKALGQYLFQHHWLSVEIVSFLLLIAVVGALYLGRSSGEEDADSTEREA